jgi:hypothetical protein
MKILSLTLIHCELLLGSKPHILLLQLQSMWNKNVETAMKGRGYPSTFYPPKKKVRKK